MDKTFAAYRRQCLRQQSDLRQLLQDPASFDQARPLFLQQHAMLHAADLAGGQYWSFEDALFDGLSEARARLIPPKGEHSIAWLVWHAARCEDITMNLLVAGNTQVLLSGGWLPALRISQRHSGNAMTPAEIEQFSAAIDLAALRAYRLAVGRQTRAIFAALQAADLARPTPPERMQQVWAQGAVIEAAGEIADYWSRRTIAGLLLMPATRHNLVHLNEAIEIK